jgi:hypothetical protein
MQIVGFLGIVFGTFFSTVGVYICAGGAFSLNIWIAVIEQGVSALVFLIIGLAVLAVGIILSYFACGRQQLNTAVGILGSCALIIPSMILGLGQSLIAGIVALVLGWATVYATFIWLKR